MTLKMNKLGGIVVTILVAAVGVPCSLHAQTGQAGGVNPADLGSLVRTREDLEKLLAYYEEVLASPVYSEGMRASTRMNADRVRERLTLGDFRVGDGVVLSVRGEVTLPDTVYVQPGPRINLLLFGDVDLAGVLRSELERTITEALALFIRDPVVRAEGLVRLSVQGAVSAPGFYTVPADMLLSEALMVAGGLSQDSDLASLRIERGAELLMGGEELQEELRQGRTLDQLNLQAGDQLVLPTDSGSGFFSNFGLILGVVSSVTLLIVQISN
jgi:protein involved in polysaccharide export with SLBB domain